jgi:hypothetical protein
VEAGPASLEALVADRTAGGIALTAGDALPLGLFSHAAAVSAASASTEA